jgi:hypothetical protein
MPAIRATRTKKVLSLAPVKEESKWVLYDSFNNKVYFFNSISEAEQHVNDNEDGSAGYLLFETINVLAPSIRQVNFNKISFNEAQKYADNIDEANL